MVGLDFASMEEFELLKYGALHPIGQITIIIRK